MPEKKLSLCKIFAERMGREGRAAELRALVKQKMGDGLGFNAARWRSMRELGYPGPGEERRLHEEWVKAVDAAKFKEVAKVVRQIDIEERRIERFEEAIASLPATSSAGTRERLDWVASHPAMGRKRRMTDKTREVVLTADDLLYSDVGRAPDRIAANMLESWVNRPDKFWEMRMTEDKKQLEAGGEVSMKRADVELDDIRKYLEDVRNETGL